MKFLWSKNARYFHVLFWIYFRWSKNPLCFHVLFYVISMVEKSTLFPRTAFDVISMTEKSTLFRVLLLMKFRWLKYPRCFYLLFSTLSMVLLLTLFFLLIRTSKFCLRLAVLNFFSILRLKCSKFVVISPTEPSNATKKNVRLSTIKTHYFIFFILFLSSSTHRQALGGVVQKKWFCNCAKANQKIPAKEFNFSLKLRA